MPSMPGGKRQFRSFVTDFNIGFSTIDEFNLQRKVGVESNPSLHDPAHAFPRRT